jgi:hypothetical protein
LAHPLVIAAIKMDLYFQGMVFFEFESRREGVLGHPALQFGRTFRAHNWDHAGFGLAGQGVTAEYDQTITF